MKKILILSMLLLVPTSGFCLSSKAVYAEQKAQAEIENNKIRANNELIMAEENRRKQEYIDSIGLGWDRTLKSVNQLKVDITRLDIVKSFSEIKRNMQSSSRSDRMNGMAAGAALGGGNGVAALYSGTSISVTSGSGHLVQNNEIIDYNNWELFKYEKNADNGLHYVYTFAQDVTTVKISDGINKILLKINMSEPNKSRISDATLPINAMNTITQVYQKKGISVSEKMLLTMLEDWYKAELMPSGKTFQDTMTGLLIDVDRRSNFLKFAKAQAKVAVKPVGDDE